MRLLPSSLFVLMVAVMASAASVSIADAQPVQRDHRRRPPEPPPPPAADTGPTSAPPSPRAERVAARKGFVWIPGRWDWRGKWEWVPGHWERERAGKRWNEGRWERKGNRWVYTAGAWVDAGSTPHPAVNQPPAPPPPAVAGPTSAPPPPRAEKIGTRAGFVWVAGHWDWRNNKWEWIPGHWERQRAGKKWRPHQWEQRDGRWVRVDGAWIDDVVVAAPPGGWPTAAPPPPQKETFQPRAGFEWIAGHWDWRNNKWEWIPGHWERQRAGKKWRPHRWEQRDGRWTRVDGDWIDATAQVAVAPPPVAPPRRVWKIEHPVVSNYWPPKGKSGTRVVIRGKNFPKDAQVVFAGQVLRGVKVKDNQITFVIPRGAATGPIAVKVPDRRRDLPVGIFEVAQDYDPVAEQRKREEEAKRAAAAAWAERQKELARDRAEREAALRRIWEERAATREARRQQRIAAIQAKWERAFLADPDTQAELTLHAQRTAALTRMRDLAEIAANGKLVIRIDLAQRRENERHEHRMAALKASFAAEGGMR